MDFEEVSQAEVTENPAEVKAPENVVLGIVGALVGALIGGASIVLLGRMGYVASLSGLILAFCTLKGYELLAKGLSKKGVIICIVLMVLTPFVADWIDWSLVILDSWGDLGLTFLDAVVLIPTLMQEGLIVMSDYLLNLGMIYLFVAMGAFYTIKNAFKKQ